MRRLFRIGLAAAMTALMAACASMKPTTGVRPGAAPSHAPVTDPAPIVSGTMRPYEIRGRRYVPVEQPNYDEVGLASWYGDAFNGRPTATGEIFNMHGLSAAHKTLPLPGLVEVTNLANGRRAVLRLNDRGPFVDGRIIDLSRGAAQELGLLSAGVGRVRVRYLGRAPRFGGGQPLQQAGLGRDPPAPRPAPAPPARPAPPSQYWVQAATYADAETAQRSAANLGRDARVETRGPASAEFRVVLGPWTDAGAAERARQAILAFGYGGALLISAN